MLSFTSNDVQEMFFIGKDSVLIYIDGGIANIEDNLFRYNGFFDGQEVAKTREKMQ